MKEYLIDAKELRTLANQAARYEAHSTNREASLAFNLLRATCLTMASALEAIAKEAEPPM